MLLQQVMYEGWLDGPVFDPYNAYAERGVQWARTLITTLSSPELDALPVPRWRELEWKDEFWSCREMAAAVLSKAAAAGMRLQLGLFMSDTAADAGRQKRPADWATLDEGQLVAQVREYSRGVAAYFKSRGLNIEVFEIGNETDNGFCGWRLGESIPVPPDIDTMNSPQWMYENVWRHFVPLFQAAIEGLRAELPDCAIALHLAAWGYSTDNQTPVAFFRSMKEAGVDYDIAGVSYPYPTTGHPFAQPYFAQNEFLGAIDAIRALGKRVQVIEFGYPWQAIDDPDFDTSAAPYGCTPEAQATFMREFAQALAGRVERINYWGADLFPGINGPGGLPADLEANALWASATQPLPAVGALQRLAADRLMDWAQQQYPALFPDSPTSGTLGPYYYRHHPTNGMYVGLDENTRTMVLHNGREYNFVNLGPLRTLIGWV